MPFIRKLKPTPETRKLKNVFELLFLRSFRQLETDIYARRIIVLIIRHKDAETPAFDTIFCMRLLRGTNVSNEANNDTVISGTWGFDIDGRVKKATGDLIKCTSVKSSTARDWGHSTFRSVFFLYLYIKVQCQESQQDTKSFTHVYPSQLSVKFIYIYIFILSFSCLVVKS